MKIFKTKKVILAVITALVLLSTLPFLQSCSSNESEVISKTNDSKVTSNTTQIDISDLPPGIIPIKFSSRAEMNNTIDRIKHADNAKLQTLSNKDGQNINYLIRIKVYKNNHLEIKSNINTSKRFKAPANENVNRDDASMFYDINIDLIYDKAGDEIKVQSNPTGFTYGQTWTQRDATKATWNSADNRIHYTVEGTITYYILIPGSLQVQVFSRNVTLEGIINAN